MARGSIASLRASLDWDLDDFMRGTSKIEGAFKGIIGSAVAMSDAVANAGKKMTLGVTLPLTALAFLTTKAASDAAELQSAFDFTFGKMAKDMNNWAEKTGNAMGRSTQQMQAGAFALGGLFKAAAPTEAAAARLSKQFTELAVDAGSFFNVPFDEALSKIRSGLAGESEPLRRFNVFINEAAVEAKGLELGLIKSGQKMNEFGKIMARQALIAEGLAPALGDAERTSGSLANSVVRLSASMSELSVEIGQILEPYARRLVIIIERLVEKFKSLPEGVKKAAVAFGVFLSLLGPLASVLSVLAITVLPLFLVKMGPLFVVISGIINPIGTLISILGNWIVKMGGIGTAFRFLGGVILRFIGGPIGFLIISLLLLFRGEIMEGIRRFGSAVSDAIGPRIRELFDRLAGVVGQLRAAFDQLEKSELGKFIKGLIGWIGFFITKLLELVGVFVGTVLRVILDVMSGIIEAISGMVDFTVKLLSGDWQGAWDAAVDVVGRAMIRISEWISGAFPIFGQLLGMIGALTGAKLTTPEGGSDTEGGGFFGGFFDSISDFFGGGDRDYALPGKTKPPKAARNGRSGPSAKEIAERREDIQLQNKLEIAIAKGDLDEVRDLERQLELRQRIAEYERAEMSFDLAKVAATKDLRALDEAIAVEDAKSLKMSERDLELQLAKLRNDFKAIEVIEDEEFIERRILELQRAKTVLDEAEYLAKKDLLAIEEARAGLMARRLADQKESHEIDLANLRGDDDNVIRDLEERRRMRLRTEELKEERMSEGDAAAQALQEGADRSRAHLQGTFREAFRGGLQAALDGDLKGFFKNWMEESSFKALSKVLDRLADSLANLIFGNSGGGGGLLGSIFGAVVSGVGGSGSGSGGGGFGQILNTTGKPKFATGGSFRIKGFPGIDKNLLSLNGNPVAQVSSGEIMDVRRGEGGGGMTINVDARGSTDPNAVRAEVERGILEAAPHIVAAAQSRTVRTLQRPRLAGMAR